MGIEYAQKKRARQVRDALNKCPDLSKIEVIAEILGIGDGSCFPCFLVGEARDIVESFPGVTGHIKVANLAKSYMEYKEASMESSDEIIRLSRLLLDAGVRFYSMHPDSIKNARASKTPADMREDLLNG